MQNQLEVIHGHVASHILEDDGLFPNNSLLPVLVYKGALHLHPDDNPEVILALFEKNGWTNGWKNGIYPYHHYHSSTHEVIGVFCGNTEVQLGGHEGICVDLNRGDVVVIPAGVAHKCLTNTHDFTCLGAYPEGSIYDLNIGEPGERPKADHNIANVAVPKTDPLYGASGPVTEQWKVKVS